MEEKGRMCAASCYLVLAVILILCGATHALCQPKKPVITEVKVFHVEKGKVTKLEAPPDGRVEVNSLKPLLRFEVTVEGGKPSAVSVQPSFRGMKIKARLVKVLPESILKEQEEKIGRIKPDHFVLQESDGKWIAKFLRQPSTDDAHEIDYDISVIVDGVKSEKAVFKLLYGDLGTR